MHSTCLGLMKKLMEMWFSSLDVSFIDEYINTLKTQWPTEFQRKIRNLKFIKDLKASEYRVWLLYISVAVMKNFLSKEEYTHFCLIHFGIRLLFLNSIPSEQNIELSQKCINKFLLDWPWIYPSKALPLSIHVTEHLPEDCKLNSSSPDQFSAFPFESFLRRVKKNYHTGGKSLEQIFCRFSEELNCFNKRIFGGKKWSENDIICSKKLEDDNFSVLASKNFNISLKDGNNIIEFVDTIMIVEKMTCVDGAGVVFTGCAYETEAKRSLYSVFENSSTHVKEFIIDLSAPKDCNYSFFVSNEDILTKIKKLMKFQVCSAPLDCIFIEI